MDIYEAVATRMSCRAFRADPVPRETIEKILEAARRTPSGGNVQPWHVHVLAGEPLAALKAKVNFDLLPAGEGTEYSIYPNPLGEPYNSRRKENGAGLYETLGIPREDRDARMRQFARNFVLFDAPVAMFFSIDRQMQEGQWSDLGMFIQTIMLLARAEGLDTCAQEAWATFHKTVGGFLNLEPELMLFCGLAIGYRDEEAVVNKFLSNRAPLEEFVRWQGFE